MSENAKNIYINESLKERTKDFGNITELFWNSVLRAKPQLLGKNACLFDFLNSGLSFCIKMQPSICPCICQNKGQSFYGNKHNVLEALFLVYF